MDRQLNFNGQVSEIGISTGILAMVPKDLMELRIIMPFRFDETTKVLDVVTARYREVCKDMAVISHIISKENPAVKGIRPFSVSYENFIAGYNAHYKQVFTPTVAMSQGANPVVMNTGRITSEQTKLADEILKKAIEAGASDIHITPSGDGAYVHFRIDGKLRDSGITLKVEDEVILGNIYKRNAGIEVNNLVGQDGRFTFLGRDFRLSTQPYGSDAVRNKIVLRLIGKSESDLSLDRLALEDSEVQQLRKMIHKPSGIILVCGPTGEGKSTTLYSAISELAANTDKVIVTVEDPIEKYIDGVAQTQVRIAETDKNSLTFARALRSMLRQDPNVIMVGEIRDKETALVAVQASQTGHLILSTLHVRNSISVFRRLMDMGTNVGGFAEQIVGITSQRLLSVNCPHCARAVVSPLNDELRPADLEMLPDGIDSVTGQRGKVSYVSGGCEHCNHTGFIGRLPVVEVIEFNNYLRDYFSERHGLIEIELYLRKHFDFRSLWDKSMVHVANGKVSLKELLSKIEPDEDLKQEGKWYET